MTYKPFEQLSCAYQLHLYFCSRTKANRSILDAQLRDSITVHLSSICDQYKYHELRHKAYDNQIRLLLSLRPQHAPGDVVGRVKGNLSRLLCKRYPELEAGQVWSAGYFAKTVGKVTDKTVSEYISNQAAHHGYTGASSALVRVYESAREYPRLTLRNHATFNLSYHLTFTTERHRELFDDVTSSWLVEDSLKVAEKKQFTVRKIAVLPNHCHLLVQLVPRLSVLTCAQTLLNNSWLAMNKRWAGVLRQTGALNVWEPSFYAGTVGNVTTAEVKAYIGARDL